MPKRYRSRPYIPGTLRAYWGVCERGDLPCLVANGLKPDAGTLLHCWNRKEELPDRLRPFFLPGDDGIRPSFMEELEARGYDLTTLRFSIKKKQPK